MNKLKLICLLPLFTFSQQKQQAEEVAFAVKIFRNLTNYFDSKKAMLDFFDFKKGDVVADVGAGEGKYEGAFSLLTDSVNYYVQDIDSKILNQASLNKTIKYYSGLKKQAQTNTFNLCIGSEKATALPDGMFDKIIVMSAFHEFTFIDEMMEDMSKKLKPNGKIYIIDSFCTKKGHVNYTAEEVVTRMKKNGFELIKMQGADKNGSKGLYEAVFMKVI